MQVIEKKRATARMIAAFLASGHGNSALVSTLAMLLVEIAQGSK